ALAGRHRRGVRERRPHRVVALVEVEGRLVQQDVGSDRDGQRDQPDDRHEVPAVGHERAPHGPAPVDTRFRSGAAFWKHGRPLLIGGGWPGQAGRVPSGWSTALPYSGPCEPRLFVCTGIDPPAGVERRYRPLPSKFWAALARPTDVCSSSW